MMKMSGSCTKCKSISDLARSNTDLQISLDALYRILRKLNDMLLNTSSTLSQSLMSINLLPDMEYKIYPLNIARKI